MATKRKTRSTVEVPASTVESSATTTRAKSRKVARQSPKIISEPEKSAKKPKKEEAKQAALVTIEETNRSIEKKPKKTGKAKEESKVPEKTVETEPAIFVQPPVKTEETKNGIEKKPPGKTGKDKKEPKIHKCYICDKIFRGLNDLRKHLRIHSDERPYQ